MTRYRWTVFCLALLAVGLVAAATTPGVEASGAARTFNIQENPGGAGDRNLLSLPGIFTLRLGSGGAAEGGGLRLDSTTVDLPALNATATVDGLTVNVRDGSYSWESITLAQAAPAGGEEMTISNTQAVVQGPAAKYSTELSTRIDLHPNEATQAGASLTFGFDGATGQASLAVADGSVQIASGPATVNVEGVNAGDGAFTIDSAQVWFPEAETGIRLDGFVAADGAASWESLAWYGQEFKIGDAVTLSDNLVVLPGPANANPEAGGATTTVAINAGDAVQAGGQLVLTYDQTTGQAVMNLRNGSFSLGASGWTLAANGINSAPGGATMDTLVLTAEPLGVQAQVSGLTLDQASGMTFDQARVLYLPNPIAPDRTVGGFELVIDSSDAGYVVTTTTLLPSATASSQP